jgi:hypothetical protein
MLKYVLLTKTPTCKTLAKWFQTMLTLLTSYWQRCFIGQQVGVVSLDNKLHRISSLFASKSMKEMRCKLIKSKRTSRLSRSLRAASAISVAAIVNYGFNANYQAFAIASITNDEHVGAGKKTSHGNKSRRTNEDAGYDNPGIYDAYGGKKLPDELLIEYQDTCPCTYVDVPAYVDVPTYKSSSASGGWGGSSAWTGSTSGAGTRLLSKTKTGKKRKLQWGGIQYQGGVQYQAEKIKVCTCVPTYFPSFLPTSMPTSEEPTDNPTSEPPTGMPTTYIPTYFPTTYFPTTHIPTELPTTMPT